MAAPKRSRKQPKSSEEELGVPLPPMLTVPVPWTPAHKGGRPGRTQAPFVANDYQRGMVKVAVTAGLGQEAIAHFIINPDTGKPISVDTLVKHFSDEMRFGPDESKLNLYGSMQRNAIFFGDTRAGIFLLKARHGFSEEPRQEAATPGVIVVPEEREQEDWEQLAIDQQAKLLGAEDTYEESQGDA